MQYRNSKDAYGSIAQALHWVIAALVFIQLGIGLYVDDLPVSLARLQWLSWHKSLGFVIFILAVLRLGWRFASPAPPLPDSIPAIVRQLARFTHWMLYALLIAAPLAGWMHASAAGLGVNVFGWFALPNVVPRDPGLAELFHDTHSMLVWTLAALVVLHVAAALNHALVLRDGIVARMLPWTGTRRSKRGAP